MANQLLTTYGLGFRLIRKLSTGASSDLVVYDNNSATSQNIRVYGVVDAETTGKVHIEFTVNSSDCVITTLDASAVNQVNSCGMMYFFYKNTLGQRKRISIIMDDFVVESGRPSGKYNIFLNGTSQAQDLPPLS